MKVQGKGGEGIEHGRRNNCVEHVPALQCDSRALSAVPNAFVSLSASLSTSEAGPGQRDSDGNAAKVTHEQVTGTRGSEGEEAVDSREPES